MIINNWKQISIVGIAGIACLASSFASIKPMDTAGPPPNGYTCGVVNGKTLTSCVHTRCDLGGTYFEPNQSEIANVTFSCCYDTDGVGGGYWYSCDINMNGCCGWTNNTTVDCPSSGCPIYLPPKGGN